MRCRLSLVVSLFSMMLPGMAVSAGPASELDGNVGELIDLSEWATGVRSREDQAIENAAQLIESGRHADAIAALEIEAEASPASPRIWFMLAIARYVSEDNESAIDAARNAIRLDPDWPQARWLVGTMLAEAGEFDRAEIAFAEAIEIAPLEAGGYLQRARFRIFSMGDHESLLAAVRDLERSAKLGAPRVALHGLLGIAYRKAGDRESAIASFRAVLAEDPENIDAVCELVRLYDQAGAHVRANRLLLGLGSEGRTPIERAKLAVCRADHADAVGDDPATVDGHYRDAVSAAPDYVESALAYAHWLDRNDRNADAVPVLDAALRSAPNDQRIGAQLAWALAAARMELPRAAELIEAAIERDPESPYLADTAAWIAFLREDFKAADRLIPRFESLAERVPEVAFHIAAIHAALGRTERAEKFVALALRTESSFPGREEALVLRESLE